MADWLSRAKSLFQKTPPPMDPFEVECDCGTKVVGLRMNVYQRPGCSVCERPVFVLPANIYPAPSPKSKPKNTSTEKSVTTKPTRISANTVVDLGTSVVPAKNSDSAGSAEGRAEKPTNAPEQSLLHDPSAPILTSLRMIVATVVMFSAVMVGGLWHRYRLENARATVAQAMDAGFEAIRDHDFAKASVELERARAAVDVIGRMDPSANQIRRLSREATAIHKLATSSLASFLEMTLAASHPKQTEPIRISSFDQDSWVIFDACLVPADEGNNRYVVDAPLQFDVANVMIEIESTVFKDLPREHDLTESHRVIFAAQLRQLSSPKGEPPSAVLTLNGKSAFLWSNYETYSAVGYRPFDADNEQQTRAVLERQLELQQK